MGIDFNSQSISKVPLNEFFFPAINLCKGLTSLIERIIVPGSIPSKTVSAHAVKHIVIFEPILRFSKSSLFETSKEANRDV